MRRLSPRLTVSRIPRVADATPTPPSTVYPSDLSGLQFWYDASQDSRITGQEIIDFPDHSGNGRNLLAVNYSYPMIYYTGGPNNAPYVYFPNDNIGSPPINTTYFQLDNTGGMESLTAGHFFIILKNDYNVPPNEYKSGLMSISGTGTGECQYPDGSGYVRTNMMREANSDAGSWGISFNAWHVLEVSSAANSYFMYTNGTQRWTTATNTFHFRSIQMRLGVSDADLNYYFCGGVAEWFMFDHVLSAGDQTSMRSYLDDKYFP